MSKIDFYDEYIHFLLSYMYITTKPSEKFVENNDNNNILRYTRVMHMYIFDSNFDIKEELIRLDRWDCHRWERGGCNGIGLIGYKTSGPNMMTIPPLGICMLMTCIVRTGTLTSAIFIPLMSPLIRLLASAAQFLLRLSHFPAFPGRAETKKYILHRVFIRIMRKGENLT